MSKVTLDNVTYYLHPGQCVWFVGETGKTVYDINLINKLFGMLWLVQDY